MHMLMDKKSMTAKELASYFEVSSRTILRDIDALSAAGIPVYTVQGKGGGIALIDDYVFNKTAITEDEQSHILFALQSLAATEYVDAKETLQKMSAFFSKTDTSWIEVDFSRWGQAASDNEKFNSLKHAILGKTAIQFEYVSSYGETSNRKMYPLRLVFKSKSWYLQGFCKDAQDYRTFKINRMLHICGMQEHFDDKAYAAPPIEDATQQPESLVQLELLFPKHVAYRVYDEFDEGAIEKADDGSLHVFARLPEDNWLYGFLLSFGRDVRVLQPAHVRDNLTQKHNST